MFCYHNPFKQGSSDGVFAGEFLYDENGVACWPKNVVNYTTKTLFLFRINQGVLDISDDDDLNHYTPEENRPMPLVRVPTFHPFPSSRKKTDSLHICCRFFLPTV